MPVTTALEHEDLVDLHLGDTVVVEAEPVVSRLVNPANVVTSISGSTLVSDDSHELVVTSVEAHTVRPI